MYERKHMSNTKVAQMDWVSLESHSSIVTHFSKDKGKYNKVLDFYEDVNESAEGISNKIKSILLVNGVGLSPWAPTS